LPAIDIDLPTPVQHSLDPPSSPTHHNAPEPPAYQLSSPTPGSLAPLPNLLHPTFLFDDQVAHQPHLPGFKTT